MTDEVTYKEVRLSDPQYCVHYARTPLILDMAGQGSGKSENIGMQTIEVIEVAPKIKGFIGANTYGQLTTATLDRVFTTWKRLKGWEEYDKQENPDGVYVIDKKPPAHFKVHHKLKKYGNTISFANGCLIFLGSMDNWKALDGKEIGWAHLDETKDTEEKAVRGVIMGRIRQPGLYHDQAGKLVYEEDRVKAEQLGYRSFGPLYIHTSPSYEGVDWLAKMFKLDSDDKKAEMLKCLMNPADFYYYQDDDVTVVIYQSFWNAHNLRPGKIEELFSQYTNEEQMLFIYGYPFTKTGGEYFKEYRRRKHVVPRIALDPRSTLYLTYDFNVRPYITCIAAQIDRVVRFYNKETGEKIDYIEGDQHKGFAPIEVMRIKFVQEFCLKPPLNRTEDATDAALTWYKNNGGTNSVQVYGDGSGHNEITGLAPLTQYKVIKRIAQKHTSVSINAKTSNIANLSRQKLLEKIFAGVFPEIEVYISDAGCPKLIRDFEFLKEAPEGGKFKETEIDPVTKKKYEKIGHTSDAGEYLICEILKAYLKYLV